MQRLPWWLYKKERDTRVALILILISPLSIEPPPSQIMENWNKISSSIASLNIGQSASKFAKGFNSNVQAAKERLGQVSADELTDLPPGLHPSPDLLIVC